MTTIGCDAKRDGCHLERRAPKRNGGFSWGRFPLKSHDMIMAVDYRLFRRDLRGKLHSHILNFHATAHRAEIARCVRGACHRLRDKVDEIDLVLMEQEEAA